MWLFCAVLAYIWGWYFLNRFYRFRWNTVCKKPLLSGSDNIKNWCKTSFVRYESFWIGLLHNIFFNNYPIFLTITWGQLVVLRNSVVTSSHHTMTLHFQLCHIKLLFACHNFTNYNKRFRLKRLIINCSLSSWVLRNCLILKLWIWKSSFSGIFFSFDYMSNFPKSCKLV